MEGNSYGGFFGKVYARLSRLGRRHGPKFSRSFPTGPESDKRTERKSKVNTILRTNAGCFQNDFPAFRPPLPGFFSIEPIHGIPSGARGLMNSNVVFLGEGQVSTERRMANLIFRQFALGRKRQVLQALHGSNLARALG